MVQMVHCHAADHLTFNPQPRNHPPLYLPCEGVVQSHLSLVAKVYEYEARHILLLMSRYHGEL
jgi:hypothetical protein